jgi:flagellar assembly protein FliH
MSDNRATNARQTVENGKVIPKEQMTAYQRWELSSFDLDDVLDGNQIAGLPAQQRIQNQARDAGYAAGHDAGYAAGIQQAQSEAAQIHLVLQNLQEGLHQMDQQIAQSLLDLSLAVANKMVHETLQVKPEVILEIIREAIGVLPQFNQNAHLILNPADAELVHQHMNDELTHAGWKIFTDPQIQRGGCLVKTAHSLIEATTEERWKRILHSMGQDHSWII